MRFLTYVVIDEELCFSLLMVDSSGNGYMVFLYIDIIDGYYNWSWIEGTYYYYLNGSITASTWASNSLLGISYYTMPSSLITSARKLASSMMTLMLSYIKIDYSGLGISAYDLGFYYF